MDQSSTPTRVCNTCHEEKPLTAFQKDRECRLGHKNRCTLCDRDYNNSRYQVPEIRARKLALMRARRAADPEPMRRRNRDWISSHPEIIRQSQKRWRDQRDDDAWLKARERTRRHKYTKETGRSAEEVDYRAILERDGFVCHICRRAIEPAVIRNLNFDHIVPPSLGGTHTMDNIAVAHIGCNIRKRNKHPHA